ncbi:MAG: DMT family transporter [Pseudomonadota bacterium]
MQSSRGHAAAHGIPLGGIVLLIAGLSAAAFSGALMKLLTETMPPLLIVWFRFTGYFVLMVPVVALMSRQPFWSIPRPGMQILRGLTMIGATVLFVSGARTLGFADAVAILYAYPFLLTLAAPWVLGEKVSTAAWAGVAGGFLGVLVVVRPSFDGVGLDAVLVFGCACLVAMQLAINRKLGEVADPLATSCYGAFVAMCVTTLALPWLWQPVTTHELLILGLLAITGAVSQTAMVMAFMRTPASDLAPFTYSEIVSAVVFGVLIFGTWPDMWSWIGIALIVAAGIGVARAMSLKTTARRTPKV